MKDILLVLANLFLVSGVLWYLFNVVKKGITPNPVTFGVRGIVAVMNLFSYTLVVNKDMMKASVTFFSTFALIVGFAWALRYKQMTKVNKFDIISVLAVIIIGIFWRMTGNPVVANILLQVIMFSSCVPAVIAVIDGRAKEEASPWFLTTLCYMLMTTAILLDLKSWTELVHPILSGIGGNGIIWLSILYRRR